MVTVINASIYSINQNAALAYELEYDEGTKVRAVVTKDGWIYKEGKLKGEAWKAAGEKYRVKANAKRQGERMIKKVKDFLGD